MHTTDRKIDHSFLSGGGEMGDRIRKKDWSKTAVGKPETWPKSLLTTLSIMLESKFPMFLWWGNDLLQFYNDAYRPSFGNTGKHPNALGQHGKDCWIEIWPVIKPLIDSVVDKGESHWSEDQLIPIFRNGRLEDVYWTFSYSPIKNDDGNINGVLVVCSETTEKVISLREMKMHEAMQKFTIDAAELCTWDLDPSTNKFTGNDRLKEWLGLESYEQMDFADALNAIVPQCQERVVSAIEDALNPLGNGSYEIEYDIVNSKSKKRRTVIAKGKALFENNVAIRFSGILQDITEKVKTRQQIKDDAERLLLATEGTKLATWDLDLKTLELIHSPRLAVILGLDDTNMLTQNEARKNIHPDDKENIIKKAFELALKTGNYFYEARVVHTDKSLHWIRVNGKIIFDNKQEPLRMLGTMMDITEQKIAEEHTAKLAAIVNSSDDAIISKKLDGTITSWNDAAERMFGFTSADIVGQSILKLIPQHKLTEEAEIIQLLRAGKKIDHFETQRLTKDNRLIDISISTSPLRDVEGNIIGASKIARDISRQKENEKILKENKQQLEIVVDSSELGTWELELTSKKMVTSPRYLQILGIPTGEDASYDDLLARLYTDDLPLLRIAFEIARETSVFHSTCRVVWLNKSLHWIEAKGKLFYDNEHQPYKIIGTIRDLTKEKNYQQKIEESEQRFRTVADTAPVLIWMATPDKLCTFFNKAWLHFRGRTIKEEYGNGWAEGVHPDDFERCLLHYQSNFDERKEFYMEYRLLRHDGQYRWISDNGVPRFTKSGIFEGYIGACMDIHDRIVFEEKLKESENRLRIAALSGELGTWDCDLSTGLLSWDDTTREMFGAKGDEVVTLDTFLDKLHSEDLDTVKARLNEALQPEFRTHFDAEYRVGNLPNDEVRWVHARGKTLVNDDNVAYRFSGTVLNITEKKIALLNLQENEQRYRFMANAMPQFVWTGSADGVLNYFNEAVYEYSGLSHEELATGGWLQIVHPDDIPENIEKWNHAILSGEPFLFEHRFKRSDGVYRWQLSRALAQKDQNGNIQMWVGTSTDIDEIKKHEQQKNDFIKMANHELKTPVTTIKGYVQLLLKTNADSKDILLTSSLKTVDKQVTKLTNLISDLLDVTKIERGSLPMNMDVFHIGDLVNDSIKDMGAAAQTHSIILHEHANPAVFADRDRISQVLINLFTNAYKYSPHATEVVVKVYLDNQKQVVVSVQDFGIGIAEEDQDKIFERFYRVSGKDEKTFPGFGIGLYIVNEIISLHNGKLWVESKKNEGATFYFSLPIHTQNAF